MTPSITSFPAPIDVIFFISDLSNTTVGHHGGARDRELVCYVPNTPMNTDPFICL
jgi:hypothetical protein